MRKTTTFDAAAAKSFQSCLTLCDPIDGSQPGSPTPGILQDGISINQQTAIYWKYSICMKYPRARSG